MQYRDYGKTGVKVSALGCGALRLPKAKDKTDKDLPIKVLQHAFDLGVNYVDTAAAYNVGKNEIALAKALKGYRERVYVATKNHYKGTSADEWQKILDGSLRRLELEYIDFYHLHSLKWKEYLKMSAPGGPMERLRRVKAEVIIRHICFSCHDFPENIVKLIDTGEFEGMLVQYNLLDRKNEEVIAYAHEKGLGVAIMGPVGGGRLAAPSERIRSFVAGADDKESPSTPEVALRFVLANPGVSIALSGMTTFEMVDENAATASRAEPLSAAELQNVQRVLEETRSLADLYCTGCRYCMPCPNGVDIPANFTAMNYFRVWNLEEHARYLYRRLGKRTRSGKTKLSSAEACIECGECEPKCPQSIPIRERLKETAKALGNS